MMAGAPTGASGRTLTSEPGGVLVGWVDGRGDGVGVGDAVTKDTLAGLARLWWDVVLASWLTVTWYWVLGASEWTGVMVSLVLLSCQEYRTCVAGWMLSASWTERVSIGWLNSSWMGVTWLTASDSFCGLMTVTVVCGPWGAVTRVRMVTLISMTPTAAPKAARGRGASSRWCQGTRGREARSHASRISRRRRATRNWGLGSTCAAGWGVERSSSASSRRSGSDRKSSSSSGSRWALTPGLPGSDGSE